MAANQTSVHKKMDRILQKLTTLEDNDKALLKQTNYLAQLVVLARQDSARQQQESQAMLRESQAMLRDMGQMLLEIKQSSDRTEERVAAILAETRQH